ncbi:DUF2730 domain-containing protein [Vibrio mediterranei]|uniref:DUF2730 family protein n=1 Tax=Vibrio mediterranei TaxID=689 RepID=UPI001EFE7E0F|nr:DUF2730 domain-containing protein [Vibrio mediterranei]
MESNYLEVIRTWWPIAATILNLVFLLVGFVMTKTFASKTELAEQKQANQELQNKFSLLKNQVEGLPTAKEVAELTVSMEKLHGDIKEIRPQLKSLQRMSNLLLENELKESS